MTQLIAWVEIPTIDFERALNFYRSVLKLELTAIDYGTEKMACFPGGEGAIVSAPNFMPSKNGTLISFNTGNNLSETLDRIVANNGEVLQTKTKIEAEEHGYFALFIDSEGNKLGLYGDE